MNEAHEGGEGFLAAQGNAAEAFESVEEALDLMAFLAEPPVDGRGIAYGLERLLEWDSWFAFTVGGSRWMGFRHILGKLTIRERAMRGIIFSN